MKIYHLVFLAIAGLFACNSDSSKKKLTTKSGYEVVFHKDEAPTKAQIGEYAYFVIDIVDDKDSILQSVRNAPELPVSQIQDLDDPSAASNPVVEAVSLMGVGDSLSVILPLDSIQAPFPNMENTEFIKYNVAMKEIISSEDYASRIQAAKMKDAEIELELKARESEISASTLDLLNKYKAGSLDADMKMFDRDLGIYYIEEGTGPVAKPGQLVETHYYGVLMDGTPFDNSFKHGKPYPVQLGKRAVIEGWELGLEQMREGGKALFVIPHDLAYGTNGSPPVIPKNATLAFYIEVGNIYY